MAIGMQIAPAHTRIAGNLGPRSGLASFLAMGRYALALGLLALTAALVPSGMYWGMGLGGFASVTGWLAYRRRDESAWIRLAGVMGMTLALIALILAGGRFAVTYWAVGRLTDMLALASG